MISSNPNKAWTAFFAPNNSKHSPKKDLADSSLFQVSMGGFIFGYDTGQISGFLVSSRERVFVEDYVNSTITDLLSLSRAWQNFKAALDRKILMAQAITSVTSARASLLLW